MILSQPPPLPKVTIVVVAIVDDVGDLLLTRRSPTESTRPGEWEVPGGHRDKNESIEDCGRREVKEETGLSFQYLPGRVFFSLRDTDDYGVMLKARCSDPKIKLKKDEHDKYVWTDPGKVGNFSPTPPDFQKEIKSLFLKGPKVKKGSLMSAKPKKQTTGHVNRSPVILQLPKISKRKASSKENAYDESPHEWMTATERQDPEEASRDVQEMFTEHGDHAWDAVWNLQQKQTPHGNPDFDNFEADEIPNGFQDVASIWNDPKNYGDNHWKQPLHRRIVDALYENDLSDGTCCTPHGDGTAHLQTDHPSEIGNMLRALLGHDLWGMRESSNSLLVGSSRYARLKKLKNGGWQVVKRKDGKVLGTFVSKKVAESTLNKEEYVHYRKLKANIRKADGSNAPQPATGTPPVAPTSQTTTGTNPPQSSSPPPSSPATPAGQQQPLNIKLDPQKMGEGLADQITKSTGLPKSQVTPTPTGVTIQPPTGTGSQPASPQSIPNTATQPTAIASRSSKIARSLTGKLQNYPWFKEVRISKRKGRVALNLHVDPKKVNDEDEFPGLFKGMHVILVMEDLTQARPSIRN